VSLLWSHDADNGVGGVANIVIVCFVPDNEYDDEYNHIVVVVVVVVVIVNVVVVW